MAFPLLIATVWVGLRFATLLSVLHSLALGATAVLLTLAGVGPFAELANEEIAILLAQFFLVMLLVTGLLLATGRDERELLAAGPGDGRAGGGLPGRRARHRHHTRWPKGSPSWTTPARS